MAQHVKMQRTHDKGEEATSTTLDLDVITAHVFMQNHDHGVNYSSTRNKRQNEYDHFAHLADV